MIKRHRLERHAPVEEDDDAPRVRSPTDDGVNFEVSALPALSLVVTRTVQDFETERVELHAAGITSKDAEKSFAVLLDNLGKVRR